MSFFQAEEINHIVAMNLALHGFLLQGKFRNISSILVVTGKNNLQQILSNNEHLQFKIGKI